MLSSHLRIVLQSSIFPSSYPTKISHIFLISTIRATCPANINLLDFITLRYISCTNAVKTGICITENVLQLNATWIWEQQYSVTRNSWINNVLLYKKSSYSDAFFKLSTTPWRRIGEWRYSSKHSLNSALDGGGWSASRPDHFTPREKAPGTHWIGGWVGPKTVLDAVVKRKIPSSRRESKSRSPTVQPVNLALYRLSYHSSCYYVWKVIKCVKRIQVKEHKYLTTIT
jgi:hypothetical protein